jgi:hypothetical protein
MRRDILKKGTLLFLLIGGCASIIQVKIKEIAKVNLPGGSEKLRIVYVSGNATVQSAVQIRKIEHDSEFVFRNFEHYNAVDNYFFQSDSVFCIVLRDTLGSTGSKPDTMKIDLRRKAR